jgi:hypothetical protein
VPVETLLGRIPIPGGKFLQVPAGLLGTALKAIGRIGWQAFIEGVQEGGQQYLQNLIAQEVYNPDQVLTEGIVPAAGLGGGVGALAGVAREIVTSFAGRRSGGGGAAPEQRVADSVAATMQAVQEAALTKTDPARMRALVDTIAGEDGAVYLPVVEVQRLYQEGKIDDAVLQQWGLATQLPEAVASGGDVTIRARDFMTAPVASGTIVELARHVRIRPQDRTAAEAEMQNQDRDRQIADLMERMSLVEDTQAQGQVVFDTIRQELISAGRSEREADAAATLWRERYLLRAGQREVGDADALFMFDRVGVAGPRAGAETRAAVKDDTDLVIARLQSGREVSVQKQPVMEALKARGGVAPGSPLAKELQARGITSKTAPGLFKKGGLRAADNIVTSEVDVLRDNAIPTDESGYANEDALLDAIGAEFAGSPLLTEADRARIDKFDAPVQEIRQLLDAAGIDYRNASPATIRAFLDTALRSEPETEGAVETALDQDSPEFKRWFGDSKVVDANGKPLVVYHGTGAEIDSFDIERAGAGRGLGSERALFFSRNAETASLSAEVVGAGLDEGTAVNAGVVYPVYLRVENPFVSDMEFYNSAEMAAELDRAKNAGHDGVFFPKLQSSGESGTIAVFRPEQIKSVNNRGTFDPASPMILEQPDDSGRRRGAFERQRDKYGNIANIIRLTRNADRSTFLHESGHFWLFQLVEDAFDPAVRPEVRTRLQADLATVLEWFGVDIKVNAADPASVLAAIQTEHHEKWARGSEAYFMEGKAPSAALRDVFTRFAGWLRRIYAKLTALDVPLTDDVRAVMDRLLATDAAIEDARSANLYRVPSELLELLTPAERDNIEAMAEKAGAEAFHELHSRIVRQMEREARAEIRAERERVTADATVAVRRRPIYAALNLLRSGTTPEGAQLVDEAGKPRVFKLDRAELIAQYGEEIVGLLPGQILAKRGEPSVSIHVFASMAGFESGDKLRLALMAVKGQSEAAAIKAEVDAEMARRHGDVTARIEEAATEAVANDRQIELMALQGRYLRRLAGEKIAKAAERGVRERGAAPAGETREVVDRAASDTERVVAAGVPAEGAATAQIGEAVVQAVAAASPPQRQAQRAAARSVRSIRDALDVEVIKEAAKRFIRARRVRDIGSAARYEQQVARKTREIEQAIAGRDYEAAAVLMEQRLFNIYLAREARDAENNVAKARAYLATFDVKRVRERIGRAGADYLDQIDALLEHYEFRQETNRTVDRMAGLAIWLAEQEAQGLSPEVPAEVLARAAKISHRDATYGELMALRDAVKSIAHVATFKNKLLRAKEKRELDEIVAEGIEVIEANTEERPLQINPQRQDVRNRMNRAFSGYMALVTKARTWLETLDGFEKGGFFDRMILAPIRDAEIRLLNRKDAEARAMQTRLFDRYGRWAFGKGSEVHIPAIGASLNLEERLAVALNWGNESSREAMLDDRQRRWSEPQVEAILDTLTERDWQFVQDAWDYIDSFWPEASELHRRRTGLPPEKVEAMPVQTKFGTLRGGYYPLAYDSDMSSRTRDNSIEDEFKGMNAGRYAAAATKRGHLKERVGSGGQSIRLSLDVLPRHVNQVLTDVEMGPVVSDVWKLLNHSRMKDAISGALGLDAVQQLDMWIKDTAIGQVQAADQFSRMFRGLRTSVSAGAMGWKMATSLIQLTGFSQTMVEVGYKYSLMGMLRFVSNPVSAARSVHAASPFMAARARSFHRDVADALAAARGKNLRGKVLSTLFFPIAKMQMMVDVPTWIGAYQRAVREGKPDPVVFADSMVEAAQSSGLMSTLSPIERGTWNQSHRLAEPIKLWTAFYSYFNAKLNIAARKTKGTDFRSPVEIAELAADYLMLFWVEAALGELLLNALPNAFGGEDDDEDRTFMEGVWHQVGLTAENAAATLPLFREGAAVMRGFDAGPSPTRAIADVAGGARETGQALAAVFDEDEDVDWGQLLRAMVSAGNVLSPIKYPASQINVALRAMERAEDGDDVTWIDYLLTKRR